MPSVFTPNNDYKNDLFIPITYDCITNSALKIYNKWGVEVYYSQFIGKVGTENTFLKTALKVYISGLLNLKPTLVITKVFQDQLT